MTRTFVGKMLNVVQSFSIIPVVYITFYQCFVNYQSQYVELPSTLLSPSSKKNLTKPTTKKFLIFQGMELSTSKIKKLLIFWEMELSGSNIKKFLIFSQKKAFLIFRETKPPKKLLIFQETEICYISENRNPKRLLIFQEVNFRAQKIKNKKQKKLLLFSEMELSSLPPKKLYKTFLNFIVPKKLNKTFLYFLYF